MEILRIFDEDMNWIGEKSRDEIHEAGYWHETFHCWFTLMEEDECYVLLQKRAAVKKDYPGLLDITSAGHLSADERVDDGIREVKEELGVDVSFEELTSLGVMKTEIRLPEIWDREFCHVFLYKGPRLPEFNLQKEEVESIYKGRLNDLIDLFEGKKEKIQVDDISGASLGQLVRKEDFVGESSYFIHVFKKVRGVINK